jgi:aquaporin Z
MEGMHVTSNAAKGGAVSASTHGLQPTAHGLGPLAALRRAWPEYLIEGWALGMFMLSACVATIAFEHPASPLHQAIASADLRRLLIGLAMGATAMALIYSPWGKRSGAHMNPSVTLAFLRLGKISLPDALFYIVAQFIGGTLGVYATKLTFGAALTVPEVNYAVTIPGPQGVGVALIAEFVISMLMMCTVLWVSNSARWSQATGVCAGVLVATFIMLEAPLSGMSMNTARSFASALPAGVWTDFWLYALAPIAGMQAAVALFSVTRGCADAGCAKLLHPPTQRCIHCGYQPEAAQ